MNEFKTIEQLCLGIAHMAFISNNSGYTCGNGYHGVLGHGNNLNEFIPRPIAALVDEKIVHIALGRRHLLSLAENGKLYACGYNLNGVFINKSPHRSVSPVCIELPLEHKVVSVFTNDKTTVCVDENDDVHSYGKAAFAV